MPWNLLTEVARTRDQEFTAFVRDSGPYLHKTALLLANLPGSGYAWWTTSELRSLPGVVRCGGLPVTFDGDESAEFTIASWNGEDAGGSVPCASSPRGLTRVERQALGYCAYFD